VVTNFSDSVAVALSAPSRRRIRGLDLLLWAPLERHGEVGDLVVDIASRLSGRPCLVELAVPQPGDLRDRLDDDSQARLETIVGRAPADRGLADGTLIIDGPQVARSRRWKPLRDVVEAQRAGAVVVILDEERGLPLDLSGNFVHLELSDDEPLRDPRLQSPRARLSLDLRHADRLLASWPAQYERTLAAIDDFRDDRWTEAYDEGHGFSRISRHAVPRPWTYRLAARAAAAAAVWGVSPDRLLRGSVGPRFGALLADLLRPDVADSAELPPSEGSAS
jgi:hypothetical protein